MEIFAFFVITFVPIEILTCLAPQNDCLNFSFVKDIKVVVKKMTRNGRKMATCSTAKNMRSLLYRSDFDSSTLSFMVQLPFEQKMLKNGNQTKNHFSFIDNCLILTLIQYDPTFTKGGYKERTVYHVRERCFIST